MSGMKTNSGDPEENYQKKWKELERVHLEKYLKE